MAIIGETMRGRYTDTHRVLGRGAYASVRLGLLERPNGVEETCALKYSTAGSAVELEADIDLLRTLEHPNVVAVKDVIRSS